MPKTSLADLKAQVGTTVTTVEGLEVEAGKVEEFARAVKDDNPAHRDAAAAEQQGFPEVPAPLTFTRTAYFPRYRPEGVGMDYGMDLGLHWDRLVHGEQEYEFERPIYVGDVLRGETTLADVYQRESAGTLTFLVYETKYRDADGNLVLTERLTRIETPPSEATAEQTGAVRDEPVNAVVSETSSSPGGDPTSPPQVPNPTALHDLSVGEQGPELVVETLNRQDFVRYAGASGDFSRLHYDEPYTRSLGYESVFAQGMLTMGIAAHLVADWFGLERVTTIQARFQDQVWPGDSMTVTGEVIDIGDEGGERVVEAAIQVTTDPETEVLTGNVVATPSTDDALRLNA